MWCCSTRKHTRLRRRGERAATTGDHEGLGGCHFLSEVPLQEEGLPPHGAGAHDGGSLQLSGDGYPH